MNSLTDIKAAKNFKIKGYLAKANLLDQIKSITKKIKMSFKKILSFLLKVSISFLTFYYIFDKLISDKFSLNIDIFYSKTILFLSLIILISYCLISLRLYIIISI